MLPFCWYLTLDTIHKDQCLNSGPFNCVTEFLLFYPRGSRANKPFPFRAKEMHQDGFSKRLFSNNLMIPRVPPKQLIKAGPDAQKPKQVLDPHQQQPMTWFQMFLLFMEADTFSCVFSIGSGVGVVIFLIYFVFTFLQKFILCFLLLLWFPIFVLLLFRIST